MNRRTFLIASACFAGLSLAPARSQADRKSDLLKLARDKRYFLDALIVEKLVSFDLTPQWWEVTLVNSNPDYEANWYQFLTLGQGMRDFAKKIGWGDVHQLDRSTGGEAKNPQVTEMVDSWKGKMSGKVVLKFPVDDEARKYVFKNVGALVEPMLSQSYLDPRGGQFHYVVEASPQAKKTTGQVSSDGNNYSITVPAYLPMGPAQIEPIYRQGHK